MFQNYSVVPIMGYKINYIREWKERLEAQIRFQIKLFWKSHSKIDRWLELKLFLFLFQVNKIKMFFAHLYLKAMNKKCVKEKSSVGWYQKHWGFELRKQPKKSLPCGIATVWMCALQQCWFSEDGLGFKNLALLTHNRCPQTLIRIQ